MEHHEQSLFMSFHGSISHSTLTTLQNRSLVLLLTATKLAPPSAFLIPVLVTTVTQPPRQNLQVIPHSTCQICPQASWPLSPNAPSLLHPLCSHPGWCPHPRTTLQQQSDLLCLPLYPSLGHPFSSQTHLLMLLFCIKPSVPAWLSRPRTYLSDLLSYPSPSHSLCFGKPGWCSVAQK